LEVGEEARARAVLEEVVDGPDGDRRLPVTRRCLRWLDGGALVAGAQTRSRGKPPEESMSFTAPW
jgi:hypothetical protein